MEELRWSDWQRLDQGPCAEDSYGRPTDHEKISTVQIVVELGRHRLAPRGSCQLACSIGEGPYRHSRFG